MEVIANLFLHDWTHQLYFSLHVKYQSYGYTWPIAEDIKSQHHLEVCGALRRRKHYVSSLQLNGVDVF